MVLHGTAWRALCGAGGGLGVTGAPLPPLLSSPSSQISQINQSINPQNALATDHAAFSPPTRQVGPLHQQAQLQEVVQAERVDQERELAEEESKLAAAVRQPFTLYE